MSEKIKIRISEDAYYRLTDILKEGENYTHLRISYKDGCCGSSKAEISLDKLRDGDTEEIIDELPIAYDCELLEKAKEITLVFRNGSFMIKTELKNGNLKDCSTCTSGCGGKGNTSSGCSGCGKKDGCH